MAELSNVHVRRMLLAVQGLARPRATEPGPEDVLDAIRRMHALQIDTISVVARSPYLVLWSRLGDYEPKLVDELLASHALFEHWSHAACLLGIEDYPLYRRMMLDAPALRRERHDRWLEANGGLVASLLARIRDEGPVRSSDFERPGGQKGSGWWDWKVEKHALELLFMRGDLMVTARRNFQRIYDLRERVLPEWDDSLAPPPEQARRALALKVVRTLGVARPEWVALSLQHLWWGQVATRRRIQQLAADGELIEVAVEGWKAPGYVHPENMPLLEAATAGALNLPGTELLSPFDPVAWDRARALDLFGFDYKIECYTPAPKRRYGYFTLPILHGDRLVGRLDPKAHRKDGIFEVKSVHLEEGVEIDAELVSGLADTLRRIAAWHRTPEVVVRQSDPAPLKDALIRAL